MDKLTWRVGMQWAILLLLCCSGFVQANTNGTVYNTVSPRRPYPTVIGCNQDHDADTCEVRVPHDSRVHTLTCVMEHVKPAVDLKWIHLFLGAKTVLNASTTVLPANTDSRLRINTYSTSASIQVEAVDDEVYECEAVGVAVGGSSARTRVRLTIIHPITVTDGEVQSSNNQGTTLVWTGDVPPVANELSVSDKGLIVGLVGSFLIFIIGLSVYIYHMRT